jgi:putative transposase
MCRRTEVSRSGYCEWKTRPESATAKRRELLKVKITALFEADNEEYGCRRVHRALVRGGGQCSPGLVRRLMRELGPEPCQPGPYRHSLTEPDGAAPPVPGPVNRGFTAERPGRKMAGDITYIPTWEGWVFLAAVTGCATRKIVGWAMDDNYRTPLIAKAIRMAARNVNLPGDAVFHSGRGSSYMSGEFAKELRELGIRQSAGRTGICFDNALAESVNGTLKVGLVRRTVYPERQKAYKDIARWIELRCNRARLHPGLGYRAPQEVMDEFLNGQAAA